MAYLDDDQSVHDGQPIELYKFEGPSASLSFYYTSYHDNVLYLGDTYVAVPLARNSIRVSAVDRQPEMVVQLPRNLDIVQEYAFSVAPRNLELTVFRMHTITGDAITYWSGSVSGFSVSGDVAKLRSASKLGDALDTEIPAVYYQSLCNHRLYDTRCGVVEASFTTATTVSSVSGTTVVVGAVGPNTHKAGEIVRASDGERRTIVAQSGTTLTITHPFRELNVSDSVDLKAGCDHSVSTCKTTFSNVINFGGHPNIPVKDVTRVGLKGV